MNFNLAVNTENKCNLIIFSTIAKEQPEGKDKIINQIYFTQMLPQILPASAKLPFQNKRFCDNFLLGLWLTACAL